MPKKNYQIIAMGGTFDHLHLGHQKFISFASQFAERVHIGITDKKLTQHKDYSNSIQTFETRRKAVMSFCQKKKINCQISKLSDPYGSTLEDSQIRAIAATQETMKGADKINEIRQAMGKKALPIHICPWVNDENGRILNSSNIRAGKVNRDGIVYANILQQDLKLSQTQRDFFSKAQGRLINNNDLLKTNKQREIYVVGDSSLEKFLKNKLKFDLAVYDNKIQRKKHDIKIIHDINPSLSCHNPAGNITLQLSKALKKCLNNKYKYLFVNGEEDAATLALVLLVPLDSHIYYGQPHTGIVDILVSEEVKKRFYKVLAS